jgi:hypothetical protein
MSQYPSNNGQTLPESNDPAPFGQQSATAKTNPYASIPVAPGHTAYQPGPAENMGDTTGGIIPYKNPKALIAYHLGILSGLPIIGLPLGIAAFVLGIQGLRARKANPVIKGSIHAGIGIGCGGFFALIWTLALAGILIALLVGA